jgi:hypothetical protein
MLSLKYSSVGDVVLMSSVLQNQNLLIRLRWLSGARYFGFCHDEELTTAALLWFRFHLREIRRQMQAVGLNQ